MLKDMFPSSNTEEEKKRVKALEKDLLKVASELEKQLAQKVPIPGIHMEESGTNAVCNIGEIPRVVNGDGTPVENTVCGEFPDFKIRLFKKISRHLMTTPDQ